MSRKVWGAALTVLAAILIAVVVFWYMGRKSVTPPEEQKGTELVDLTPAAEENGAFSSAGEQETEHAVEAEAVPDEAGLESYQFVLVNHDNYVTVYQLPERELYEYTDVILDVLPAELQEEIRRGKYLRSEEELYNFLENYTS